MVIEDLLMNYLIHRGIRAKQLGYNIEPEKLKVFREETKSIINRAFTLKVKVHSIDTNNVYMFRIINDKLLSPNFSFAKLDAGVDSFPIDRITEILVSPEKDKSLTIIYHSKA